MPHIPRLLTELEHLDGILLAYGIMCFVVFFFIRGFIWYQLLHNAGYKLTFRETCYLWAFAEIKRYIPGNLWSFLGRSVTFSERGVAKKDIASNLIIEIELLLLGSMVVSLFAIPFFFTIGFPVPTFLLIGGSILILLLYTFHANWKKHLSGKLRTTADFLLPKSHPIQILFLILLSTVSFIFFGLAHYFAISSFMTINPQLVWQISGFCVFAFLIGYLSLITPSGLGVREAILVWGFSSLTSLATAGFLALFARIVFIVSEVIFVALTLLWHTVRNPAVTKIQNWIGSHKQVTILIGCYLIYVIYFTTITFLRYDHFYTGRFDLGNMAQTVWNTTQGRFFEMTNPNGTETVSRLAFHADFILALLAPFYMLWANPKTLLLIQTVVLAAGAFFVYVIAKEIVKNSNVALTFALLFLLNPSVERTNIYDFHAVTLATTFLLATFYYFIKKRYFLFLLFAFLAGICKEQVWFIIGLFGIFLFFWHKQRLFGTVLFIVAVSLSYTLISYAIPHALGSQHFALEYYAELGNSPSDILKTMLLSPDKIIGIAFQPDRIGYLQQLFSPLAYTPLLAPIFLIFAAPDLVINLLSNNDQLHQIYYQYPATITPFLFIAAIYGVKVLLFAKHKISQINISDTAFLTIVMCVMSAATMQAVYDFGPLPGAKQADIAMITNPVPYHKEIDEYIATIDPSAHVTASNNIASHFSEHQFIYVEPMGLEKADYAMFLVTSSLPISTLASERELIEKLKKNPEFTLVHQQEAFFVFKKNAQ